MIYIRSVPKLLRRPKFWFSQQLGIPLYLLETVDDTLTHRQHMVHIKILYHIAARMMMVMMMMMMLLLLMMTITWINAMLLICWDVYDHK